MPDDQTVQPDAAAVAEPAATAESPAAAPASDATPAASPQAEAQTPTPDPSEVERQRAELEAERQQIAQQKAQYEAFQREQAEAQRRQQIEATRQQYEQRLGSLADRVLGVDTADEARKLVNEFVRDLVGPMHQAHQAELQQRDQQYQQQFSQYEQSVKTQLVEAYKPIYAETLVAQHGLPPQMRDVLMRAPSPDDMPAIAEMLKSTLAQSAPQVQQQVAASQADAHRANNTFAPSAGGGPLPDREMPVFNDARSPENVAMLSQILGLSR